MLQTFGQTLRALRRSKEVSQRELAARVGVDFSYISKLENDRVPPPAADTIVKIAEALGEQPDGLLAITGKMPSPVKEMLTGSPAAMEFMRHAQHLGLTDEEWQQMAADLKRLREEP